MTLKAPLNRFCFFLSLAILCLHTLSISHAIAAPVRISDMTPDELERTAATSALKKDWRMVRRVVPELIKVDPAFKKTYVPLLAHALVMSNETERARKLLKGRVDMLSVLTGASYFSGAAPGPGDEALFNKPAIFIFKMGKRNNGSLGGLKLGIFPRNGENIALKRAFYSLIENPTIKELDILNKSVLAKKDIYFLGGEVLWEGKKSLICMAFVDMGRLKSDLAISTKPTGEKVSVALITRQGNDKGRKSLAEHLKAEGFNVEDFGRGNFHDLDKRGKLAGIVLELDEEFTSGGGILKSRFKKVEGRTLVTIYNAVTGKELGIVRGSAAVVHMNEMIGGELSVKKAYEVSSRELVARLRGIKGSVDWSPGTSKPVVVKVAFEQIFSSNYKYYAENPFGEITLRNNTARDFGSVKVSFRIKDYVDYPSEITVGRLPSDSTLKKGLKSIFNSRILELTGDTFLQSEIKVSYFDLGEEKVLTSSHPIYVYEKHALVWDDKGKIASFITPKDPVVMGFARDAVAGYKGVALNKSIVKAKAVFEGMGVIGISYMEDPNNPYGVVSGLTDVVDYVQFPRETLVTKTGDCDDLTSLYASALESLGLRTRLLDAPGHIYMIFDTGVERADILSLGFPEDRFVVMDGSVWVPVETTLVGESFSKAWKRGAENYNKERDELKVIDLNEARKLYKAPNLKTAEFKSKVNVSEIEKMFPGELQKLSGERASHLEGSVSTLGPAGLKRLMVMYARQGLLDEAIDVSRKVEEKAKDSAYFNNLANIYYLKGKNANAVVYYGEAAALAPRDAEILINLSRAHLETGAKSKARGAFKKAYSVDKSVKERYSELYMKLKKAKK